MYKYIRYFGFLILLFFKTATYANVEKVFRTEVFREDIKSLMVRVEGEFYANPYIPLNSEKKIEINFDALHHSSGRFIYSVVHCNADWKESGLLPIEYLKGFNDTAIENFANAFNTTTHYTNYSLVFPNKDTELSISGNYAIQIYEEGNPEEVVLTACFSVIEPLVEIEMSISGNTDIDFKGSHQQIDFTIDKRNLDIRNPHTELKVFAYQNNNLSDIRSGFEPLLVTTNRIQYKHCRELIFEAGNEYRRIEFLTHRYNGMGVEDISFHSPYYHVELMKEEKRAGKSYLYDRDQNGRFFINCSNCEDPDTQADYYIVHFSFVSEFLGNGKIHIYGDLFNNQMNEKSAMAYNAETGAYEKAVMLKQGLYNYQYVFVENNESGISFRETEGDFFETENEYTVIVYYRPIGGRYDRAVGLTRLSSNHGLL